MPLRAATAAAVLVSTLAQAPESTAPRTADSVDLSKYAGTYYETARFPNRFQKQCAGNVTTTYTLESDGRVGVVNRCVREDGTVEEARGVARRAGNDQSNARLQVRFAPAWLSFLPRVWRDHWILSTGPDYGYAVVGSPSREHLWILSRTPRMSELAYRQAVEIARANGYDVDKLVKTTQER